MIKKPRIAPYESTHADRFTCTIIGAGPAGLSLGYELQRRGVDLIILEQGPRVGYSWSKMPKHTELLSPWRLNSLPGSKARWFQAHRRTSREEYDQYLEEYAKDHSLPVRLDTRVKSITRTQTDGFAVLAGTETVRCDFIVNATGYFFNPFRPPYEGSEDTQISQMHVGEYADPQTVRDTIQSNVGKLLIVGKRVSAGHLLVELHNAGFEVVLSSRSQVSFRPHPVIARPKDFVYFYYEDFLASRSPELKMNSFPPMEGGRTKKLIQSKTVDTRPDIRRFERNAVLFLDGRKEAFDLVIYTTGFRPMLDHLTGLVSIDSKTGQPPLMDMESTEVAGLFFLGLDNQRNFRSRILRGIREDAGYVADKIAASTKTRGTRSFSEQIQGWQMETESV